MKPVRRGMAIAFAILAASPAVADDLSSVIADYETFSRLHPMEAGRSDPPDARAFWPRETPADMAARRRGLEALAKRLDALPATPKDEEDRIDRVYLRAIAGWRLEGLAQDEQRFAFVAHDGFYNVPYYAAQQQRLPTLADARAWIARLHGIAPYFDQQRANLERGIATGWTQPARVVDVAVDVLRAQIGAPVREDPLLAPFDRADGLDAAARAALRKEAEAIVAAEVRPAQQAMLGYIDGRYRQHARAKIGIDSIPGGRAYYDYLLRYYTTTDLSAEQIHAIGLAEVARIRGQMDEVIASTGFKGSFAEWLAFLRRDPRFIAPSREALIEKASAIAKRIDGQLPRFFTILPRQPFAVVPVPADVEEHYTTARYAGGDFAAGLPGRYLVNTSHLDQRPLYELPALTLHEAAPGHHTHMALTAENTTLPFFRKEGDMLVYREGWALYAEKLGEEMGIYRDAYERFGRLSTEMWRACRMVVDTGIHVMGWSYEKARACFTDNSALSDINIDTELARYIGAPAGAVAYKIGEIEIVRLRARAQAALGDRFDLRRFHDLILAQGQIPMTLLADQVERWIAANGVEKR